MVRDKGGAAHGMSVDLGQELARRLGVPYEQVDYTRIADVLEGMKTGGVDFTVSNASPARAKDVAFSQTLLSLELGYLVPAGSSILTASDIDKPGVKIGVTFGSTSAQTLPSKIPNATIVAAPNVKDAVAMLERHEIDAFATNKPILFEMSDQMVGARVLDGRWGVEHVAVAIPKGNEKALAAIGLFVADVRTSGLVKDAAARAGLRGLADTDQ